MSDDNVIGNLPPQTIKQYQYNYNNDLLPQPVKSKEFFRCISNVSLTLPNHSVTHFNDGYLSGPCCLGLSRK